MPIPRTVILAVLLFAAVARADAPPATDPSDAPDITLPRGAVVKICPSKLIDAKDRAFVIYTPPDYATSDKRYPVVYFLHGITDDHLFYFRTFSAEKNLLEFGQPNLIETGKAPPMIFVSVNCGKASWYLGKAGDFIVQELIPFVDANWRTIASREGRAIEGHSMGANGALRIGLSHPDLFSSIYAISPGLRDHHHNDLGAIDLGPVTKLGVRLRLIKGQFDSNGAETDIVNAWLEEQHFPHEFDVIPNAHHYLLNFAPDQLKGLQFHVDSFKVAGGNNTTQPTK